MRSNNQRRHPFIRIGVMIACATCASLLPIAAGHAADAKGTNAQSGTTKKTSARAGQAKSTKRNTSRPTTRPTGQPTTRAKSSASVAKTSPRSAPVPAETARSGVVGSVSGVRVSAECAPQNGGVGIYAKVFHDVHLFSEERIEKNPLYGTVSKLTATLPDGTKEMYSFREPIVALFLETSGDMLLSKEYANSFELALPPAPARVAVEVVTSAVDFGKLDNPVTKSPFATPREVYDAMYANVGAGTPLTKDRESLYNALLRTRSSNTTGTTTSSAAATSTTINFTIDVQPCSFGSSTGNLRITAA